MNRIKHNQWGLSTVAIIVASLVVAVIGVTSVFFINHKKATVKNSTLQPTSQTTTQPDTTSTQTVQSAQKYLVIKEWGVQLPYSSTDTFSYALAAGGQSVTIGSAALASKDSACATKGAGIIERFAPSDSVSVYGGTTVADTAKQNPGAYTYVNGYYYLFVPSQSACGSATPVSDQSQANNVIKTSLSNVAPSN